MIYRLNANHTLTEFSDRYVEYITTRYVPDGSLIVSIDVFDFTAGGVDLSPAARSIIENHLGHIIFDSSGHIVDSNQLYQNILQLNLTVPFYLLTGEFTYCNHPPANTHIKFFPFWTVWASAPHAIDGNFKNYNFSQQPKKYKLSCLNGMPWQHRKWVYLQLAHKPYFNDMVFSYGNRDDNISCNNFNEFRLTDEENNKFAQLPAKFKFTDRDQHTKIDITIDHPAYLETYINLVTETTINGKFSMLSEKTFKPIVAGQLFILVAAAGAVQFLRDIGIDTFDDIIDHSYDTLVDNRLRLLAVIAQVDRLMTLDIESIYNQLKPRLQRNSEYIRSEEFRQQFSLTFDN
jgi:hypothetical protein